jgi:hypothetical protein
MEKLNYYLEVIKDYFPSFWTIIFLTVIILLWKWYSSMNALNKERWNKLFLEFSKSIFLFLGEVFKNIANFPVNFFAFLAGADLNLLNSMPSSVIAKRAGFGFLMFIAVFISAAIACSVWGEILQSEKAGLIVGLGWFLAVAAIDRSILTFMDHDSDSNSWKKYTIVFARLAMVLGISYLNTTIAEMKIFEKEIAEVIQNQKDSRINFVGDSIAIHIDSLEAIKALTLASFSKIQNEYTKWTASQEAEIISMRQALRDREDIWVQEIEGLVGSGKKGYGPAAKAKREAIKQDSIRLEEKIASFNLAKTTTPEFVSLQDGQTLRDKKLAELDNAIFALNNYNSSETASTNARALDGFSHRYNALGVVAKETPVLVYAVFIMFFIFESLVVLLKMMMGRDAYDEAIRLQNLEFVVEKQHSVSLQLATSQATYLESMNQAQSRAMVARIDMVNNQVQNNQRYKDALSQKLNDISAYVAEIDGTIVSITDDPVQQQKIKKEIVDELLSKATTV